MREDVQNFLLGARDCGQLLLQLILFEGVIGEDVISMGHRLIRRFILILFIVLQTLPYGMEEII